jgi:hypothetical protein
MAVELATGYVSIVPSAKGFDRAVASQITGPLSDASKSAGEDTGDGFAAGFTGKAKAGFAVAAGVIGGVLTKGLFDGMSREVSTDRLGAQLGLSDSEMKRLGGVAGKIYGDAFGEDLGQVNEAVRAVVQNIDGMQTSSSSALKGVTIDVLNVATAFDQELGGTAAAVGQLMKTGMAKDATEALDLITVGFQKGVDKRGDFLDTLNEYGTQFRKLGIEGPTAVGLLSQGLQAGARDADIVADAVKEFSNRTVSVTPALAQGFELIGLNAYEMVEQIAKGGPAAKETFGLVLDRLRAVEDPAQRSQAAVALFGTQAEDLGAALFALDPTKATEDIGDFAGAAERMGDTLNDNAASGLESWKRKFELATGGIAQKLGPVLSVAPAFAGMAVAASSVGIPLDGLASGVTKLGGVLLTNPYVLALVGAVAIGVLIYRNWDTIKDSVAKGWDWVTDKTVGFAHGVADFFKEWWPELLVIFTGGLALLPKLVFENWDKITGFTKDMAGDVVGFFKDLPGHIGDGFSAAWHFAWDPITGGFTKVKDFAGDRIDDVVDFTTGLPGRIGNGFTGAWHFAWDPISGGFTKIKDWAGDEISDIVDFYVGLPGRAKDGLVSKWSTLWGWWTDQTGKLRSYASDKLDDLVDDVFNLPSRIATAARGMFDGIRDAFRAAVNWIIDHWNDLSFAIGGQHVSLPFGMGFTIPTIHLDTPNIPMLAAGGIVTGPTLAWIGEGANDEAVIPLPHDMRLVDELALRSTSDDSAEAATYNINVQLDGKTIARAIGKPLAREIKIQTGGAR